MQQEKETEFDFSKDSRKEPIKTDWTRFIKPTASFIQRHKSWFITGISAFLVIQGITYIFSDTPQEAKTKVIAIQLATEKIPDVIKEFEKNKENYDEIVNYLMAKEYGISTNSMRVMQEHAQNLNNANVRFKKFINEKKDTLEIINKKIKETQNYTLLTKDEKNFLLEEYARFKSEDHYISPELDNLVNIYTTVQNDDKPADVEKSKDLEKERELIKKEVSEIKKRNVKKIN